MHACMIDNSEQFNKNKNRESIVIHIHSIVNYVYGQQMMNTIKGPSHRLPHRGRMSLSNSGSGWWCFGNLHMHSEGSSAGRIPSSLATSSDKNETQTRTTMVNFCVHNIPVIWWCPVADIDLIAKIKKNHNKKNLTAIQLTKLSRYFSALCHKVASYRLNA